MVRSARILLYSSFGKNPAHFLLCLAVLCQESGLCRRPGGAEGLGRSPRCAGVGRKAITIERGVSDSCRHICVYMNHETNVRVFRESFGILGISMTGIWASLHVAVCTDWESFLWLSFYSGPYYFGTSIGAADFWNLRCMFRQCM